MSPLTCRTLHPLHGGQTSQGKCALVALVSQASPLVPQHRSLAVRILGAIRAGDEFTYGNETMVAPAFDTINDIHESHGGLQMA